MDKKLNAMLLAAEEVSTFLQKKFSQLNEKGETLSIAQKQSEHGLMDFVSEADTQAQSIIKKRLFENCPDVCFQGEEDGLVVTIDNGFLVDPLDGTSNFIAGRPYYGGCIAYIEENKTILSVVYEPEAKMIYYAISGQGAFSYKIGSTKKNPMYVKDSEDQVQLDAELVFKNTRDWSIVQKIMKNSALSITGFRKQGSTAIDLVHMAQGQNSILIANYLKSYDVAAPLLIANESGVVLKDFNGNNATIFSDAIIAGTDAKVRQILGYLT